jgi:uncharacterized protein with NRDE domain
MCLIAIAHRANARFPLVIAANRDEDYDRPTHDAHFWSDAPEVLGGRDALANGSWLAIARNGRFAAVTNLRGAERKSRSRGALVRDFVTGDAAPVARDEAGPRADGRGPRGSASALPRHSAEAPSALSPQPSALSPLQYAESIAQHAEEYAGFHFFAGEAGGEAVYVTPQSHAVLEPGIHAVSNAPLGEEWPKTALAAAEMKVALRMDDAESMVLVLMQFLALPRGTNDVESEVFIKGDRYGTRASTVIVVTEHEILFGEQSFTRGGVEYGKNRLFRTERV